MDMRLLEREESVTINFDLTAVLFTFIVVKCSPDIKLDNLYISGQLDTKKTIKTVYYSVSERMSRKRDVYEELSKMIVMDGRSTGLFLIAQDLSFCDFVTPSPELMVACEEPVNFAHYLMSK